MLTPSEKIIINSIVLIMFSLIVYAIVRVVMLQEVVGVIMQNKPLRGASVTIRDLRDLVLHTAFDWTINRAALEVDGGDEFGRYYNLEH